MQLIVAEKKSVGENIAKVLGVTERKGGYMESNNVIISWCMGHLVGLALPNDEKYGGRYDNFWTFDNLPILPEQWIFSEDSTKINQLNILGMLMNDSRVDEIVCATDAGREGECIFRYIYNFIGCKKPVRRLWISSMEDSAIRQGMAHLRPSAEFDNLFSSGFARARADWLVGMNFSRLFSNRFGAPLNVGRVQTPILAMIVQRDYEVENFIKQKFFTVELDCGEFTVSSERIDDENIAKSIATECDGKNAVVSNVRKEIKTVNPPKLYDLTTLQREANRQFGYTAKQTLDYTQSLYEARLVTYPRTDSQYLTEDMEQTALDIVDIIRNYIPEYGNVIMPNPDVKRLMNNKKVSDHTAIIPTAEIQNTDLNCLPTAEKNILLLIAGKLLISASETHKYESVKITVTSENHNFTASGKTVIADGFKAVERDVMSKLKNVNNENDPENKLPEISEGHIFENVPANVAEHWTSPPKPYTEDTLLKAMETAGNDDYDEESDVEKKGLGTPATRAGEIEHLVANKYIVRDKKKISATEKGIVLVDVLPYIVKSAKLTADWETDLQNIEKGKYSAEQFMTGIEDFIRKLVEEYSERVHDSRLEKPREIIGVCPRCGKNIYEGKLNFYCESGRDGCGFTLWKEQKGGLKISVSAESAKKLLSENGTAMLKGIGKDGNEFTAEFKLTDTGKYINLDFVSSESQCVGKCPKCGGNIVSGKYGFYCKNKCGAFLGKVFGYELSEKQIKSLLSGKQISYTSNGRKTIVLPELVENNYNGKTSYVWKTQKE